MLYCDFIYLAVFGPEIDLMPNVYIYVLIPNIFDV